MKKTKIKQVQSRRPSLLAVILITWLVFLTGAAGVSLLWNWENMRAVSTASMNQWPQLVRQGMSDSYRQPIVSAQQKLFVFPELNIAIPYDDAFSGLQYTGYAGEDYQEVTLTTKDIIIASTQPKGSDPNGLPELPYFMCGQVLTIAAEQYDEMTLLDEHELSDGRTVYVQQSDKADVDCDAIYEKTSLDDFLKLVSQAQPYNL